MGLHQPVIKTRTFILHWLGASHPEEVVGQGDTQLDALRDACMRRGYSAGALRALDYWEEKKEQVIS